MMKAETVQIDRSLALPEVEVWTGRTLAAALFMVLTGIAATYDAWYEMAQIAIRNEEQSHAFLVPVAMGWLIWVRRGRLKDCPRTGRHFGAWLVVGGGALHCFADFHWRTLWYIGAVLLVVGCLVTVIGSRPLALCWPAFAVLWFVVPVPSPVRQAIAAPLGSITAQVTEHVLLLFGVPVERSGNLLSLNQIDVTIAEACNGLRMVFALFLASFIFAFVNPLRWQVRALVLAMAPLSAIVCNVIRLIPTLWLYGYHSKEWAERFHDLSGWVMLIVSFLILIGIIRVLDWAAVPVEQRRVAEIVG